MPTVCLGRPSALTLVAKNRSTAGDDDLNDLQMHARKQCHKGRACRFCFHAFTWLCAQAISDCKHESLLLEIYTPGYGTAEYSAKWTFDSVREDASAAVHQEGNISLVSGMATTLPAICAPQGDYVLQLSRPSSTCSLSSLELTCHVPTSRPTPTPSLQPSFQATDPPTTSSPTTVPSQKADSTKRPSASPISSPSRRPTPQPSEIPSTACPSSLPTPRCFEEPFTIIQSATCSSSGCATVNRFEVPAIDDRCVIEQAALTAEFAGDIDSSDEIVHLKISSSIEDLDTASEVATCSGTQFMATQLAACSGSTFFSCNAVTRIDVLDAVVSSGQLYVEAHGEDTVDDCGDEPAFRVRLYLEYTVCCNAPSSVPTFAPSQSPTQPPTVMPSNFPSIEPLSPPTMGSTTMRPTIKTLIPTLLPSSVPTDIPTADPTTTIPSNVPTTSPTLLPIPLPTRAPTSQPSVRPSPSPTAKPSPSPTAWPTTSCPSVTPSSLPSWLPTQKPSTLAPTSPPTTTPSSSPSIRPTAMPSTQPSNRPSLRPTREPSRNPSSTPTSMPSSAPSSDPTRLPTQIPTLTPSLLPIQMPTNQPSDPLCTRYDRTREGSCNAEGCSVANRFTLPAYDANSCQISEALLTIYLSGDFNNDTETIDGVEITEEALLAIDDTQYFADSICTISGECMHSVLSTDDDALPFFFQTCAAFSNISVTNAFEDGEIKVEVWGSRSVNECESIFIYYVSAAFCCYSPSAAPSSAPSSAPAQLPWPSPVRSPTIDSAVTTASPTATPTIVPSFGNVTSFRPTPPQVPSGVPSLFETNGPTDEPTGLPSQGLYTVHPTKIPTTSMHVPTKLPSQSNEESPTNMPISMHTAVPTTMAPTAAPIAESTSMPSRYPTLSPTTLAPTVACVDEFRIVVESQGTQDFCVLWTAATKSKEKSSLSRHWTYLIWALASLVCLCFIIFFFACCQSQESTFFLPDNRHPSVIDVRSRDFSYRRHTRRAAKISTMPAAESLTFTGPRPLAALIPSPPLSGIDAQMPLEVRDSEDEEAENPDYRPYHPTFVDHALGGIPRQHDFFPTSPLHISRVDRAPALSMPPLLPAPRGRPGLILGATNTSTTTSWHPNPNYQERNSNPPMLPASRGRTGVILDATNITTTMGRHANPQFQERNSNHLHWRLSGEKRIHSNLVY